MRLPKRMIDRAFVLPALTGVIIVATMLIVAAYQAINRPSQSDKLVTACRAELLHRLPSPSGTRWAGDERVTERSGGVEPYSWRLAGHADVAAITGGTVRASWTCIAQWRDGQWRDANAWIE
jgi:hypothetical protein